MTKDLSERESFFNSLDTILSRNNEIGQPVAVLLMRLLRLREINFEYGFTVGDKILEKIQENIESIQRPTDALFRITGSDFVLVLPKLPNPVMATLAADKIASLSRQRISLEGDDINVSVVIGVAVSPEHSEDGVGLLRCAELALNEAEQEFEPFKVYSGDQGNSENRMLWLESSLENAIADNKIHMHYQPQIDLRTSTVIGIEALARWTHETRGPVRPDIFVEVAEETGLIVPLTLLTMNVALRECAELLQQYPQCSLSFNLSALVLQESYLTEQILNTLRIWKIRPEQITMEVTETAIMTNPEVARSMLEELRAQNIEISMDDFGTGHSSLGYLQTLPLHELKIDKSFVMDMTNNEGDAKIVRAIINLAQNFDFSVVAEGIENEETMEVLREMGCNTAQGYFISRPMPMEEFEDWVASSRFTMA
jgi:diguanylate cyclase (GGDEF)-like protein